MDDDVGCAHLLERGAKGGDERCRQIGDEADRVGQDRRAAMGQFDKAHGRIERGEQHVGRHHLGAGQPIEQGRFPGVGVADQRDNGIGDGVAARALQGAPALDGLQILLDTDDALADQAAIGFDLGLAGAAEKAKSAALPLKMGPRSNQARALIFQVGELHLQRALGCAGPLAENLEDQPGAVDDLAAEGLFKIALLRRG